jgi:hypothetical protein
VKRATLGALGSRCVAIGRGSRCDRSKARDFRPFDPDAFDRPDLTGA